MSPAAITAERTYKALKREVLSGRFTPGAVLSLPLLAREFGTSVSPVRDAMARLSGERILEAHPGGGFQLPALREKDLADLYRWHGHLLGLVLRERRRGWSMPDLTALFDAIDPNDAPGIANASDILFDRIADCSDNAEYATALRAAGDRLHATRIAEAVIPARIGELKAVATATASGSPGATRTAIWSYQRRRLRRIREIVTAAGGTLTA